MLSDAIKNMKLDRRLGLRRGWISESELQAGLESLPDVAGKGTFADDDEAQAAPTHSGPAGD